MKNQYQQGDVLVWSEKIPADATPRQSRIVAEGEVTGHAHRVAVLDPAEEVEMYERDGVLYCRVLSESATITHEEHKPVTLPRGDFRFGIVQEYDYDTEESRRVAD